MPGILLFSSHERETETSPRGWILLSLKVPGWRTGAEETIIRLLGLNEIAGHISRTASRRTCQSAI